MTTIHTKTIVQECIEGMTILSGFGDNQDLCAEHDVIRILVRRDEADKNYNHIVKLDAIPEETATKLGELGWHWDEEECDWYFFT